MSETGFNISPKTNLSPEEEARLRQHYLAYVNAEFHEHRRLKDDLYTIYSTIDSMADGLDMADLISHMGECDHMVIFSTEASTLSLREFQLEMLSQGKHVRLVSENATEVNGIRALGPKDLLLVVTSSNAFAHRQRSIIEGSGAYKAIVSATQDSELHSIFDDVLLIGQGSHEGGPLHRIYSTFGVAYFFDRLFDGYARAYNQEFHK